jgi:hypothetical protein
VAKKILNPKKASADCAPVDPVVADEAPAANEARVLTINGQAIAPEDVHRIPYRYTDQGIAEENAKKAAEGRLAKGPKVEFTGDAWDKGLAALENFEGPDAQKEGITRVAHPEGKAFRYLSDKVIDRRGMRGWEFEEDSKGRRITVGGMALASMPKAKAQQRNAYYRGLSNEALQHAEENMQERMERTIRDAGVHGQGFAPLRSGELVHDHLNPDQAASIGVVSTRGL